MRNCASLCESLSSLCESPCVYVSHCAPLWVFAGILWVFVISQRLTKTKTRIKSLLKYNVDPQWRASHILSNDSLSLVVAQNHHRNSQRLARLCRLSLWVSPTLCDYLCDTLWDSVSLCVLMLFFSAILFEFLWHSEWVSVTLWESLRLSCGTSGSLCDSLQLHCETTRVSICESSHVLKLSVWVYVSLCDKLLVSFT